MKYVLALLLTLLSGVTYGQEVLKGKVPAMEGTCNHDRQFVLKKGLPFSTPCVMAVDLLDETKFLVVLFHNNEPIIVVEVTLATDAQKIVWRKGQKEV
jgi:hypothetical protein